jgi:hypothetical protein
MWRLVHRIVIRAVTYQRSDRGYKESVGGNPWDSERGCLVRKFTGKDSRIYEEFECCARRETGFKSFVWKTCDC